MKLVTKIESKVKLVPWKYKTRSWRSYQLPNGELVMSVRQIAAIANRPKVECEKFLVNNELVSVDAILPNRKRITTFPLQSSVVNYWLHLWENSLIPEGFTKNQWLELIKFAMKGETTEPHEIKDLPIYEAQVITLKVQKKYELEVCLLAGINAEYRLSFTEGLKLIEAHPNWIRQLENAPSKLKMLKAKGFSGLTKWCQVKMGRSYLTLETLTLTDWLIVWEFFACRGNTKAAALLRACAESNLHNWLSNVVSSCTVGRSIA